MYEKIFLSPSNQSGNKYAYGNTNEAAECGKMAAAAEKALLRCGFEVKVMQWESAQARCKASNEWGADLHMPIHTNAFNGKVAGTRTMVYEKKGESYEAAKCIHNELAAITPGTSENISTYPELIELKQPKAAAVYLEVDFHDVPDIAKWLIQNAEAVGEAICRGVCKHYKREYIAPEEPKGCYCVQVGEYDTTEQAEAMVEFLRKVGVAGSVVSLPTEEPTQNSLYEVTPQVGLWLREGPGTEYDTIELLPQGDVVECKDEPLGLWLHVVAQSGNVGYCHSDYLKKI